jgi:hypothetical protein
MSRKIFPLKFLRYGFFSQALWGEPDRKLLSWDKGNPRQEFRPP